MNPLNGTQTHPLSAHALAELRDMANKPRPRQAVNPDVANPLLREALVESVMLPSPFKTHAEHLQITEAGRLAAGRVEPAQPTPRIRIEITSSPTHPDRWRWAVVVHPRHIFAMSQNAFGCPEDCAADATSEGVKMLRQAQAVLSSKS